MYYIGGMLRRLLPWKRDENFNPDEIFDHANPNKLLPDRNHRSATNAWKKRQKAGVTSEIVQPIDPSTPISENHVRFVCLSDTHNKVEHRQCFKVPDGDVLLHTGDFSMFGLPDEIYNFNQYLGTLPHKVKVIIAGNHDLTLDTEFIQKTRWTPIWSLKRSNFEDRLESYGVSETRELLTNCMYLEDDLIEVYGIKIYGSPWQPGSGYWGFNRYRGQQLLNFWNNIPEGVDILLTHGPPAGYGDMVASVYNMYFGDPEKVCRNIGCVDLLNTIQLRVRPKYHVYGHIHEGYGVRTDGTTTFVNASICTVGYQPTNPAIVFDLPLPEGHTKEETIRWISAADDTSTSTEIADSQRVTRKEKAGCHVDRERDGDVDDIQRDVSDTDRSSDSVIERIQKSKVK